LPIIAVFANGGKGQRSSGLPTTDIGFPAPWYNMLKKNDTQPADAMIGIRLRKLRQERGLTLTTIAQRSGISTSTLSKIENDKVSPTFANLLKLADAFGLPLTGLIGGIDTAQPQTTARIAVTRAPEISFTRTQTYEMGALCADLRNKRMSPFLDRVHASAASVGDRLVQHAGEEFVYVLRGTLEIHTEHYQPLRLGPGDSAYFDSQMAHAYRAATDEPAEMLMIWLGPDGVSTETGEELMRKITELDTPGHVSDPPASPARRRGRAAKGAS
jgi:transcriptional regulator with XRE-family HTH domain